MSGRHVGIRWRDDVGWELRCESCHAKRNRMCYWPLTDEFWRKGRMTRCRSCWREHEKNRITAEQREARRLYAREWNKRNPGYNAELLATKRRLFPEEAAFRRAVYYYNNRERVLAQQREYKARKRAESEKAA